MNDTIKKYDVIVVGAGASGLNVYSFLHQVGVRALLIEKDEKNIGGDCLHAGCIPSKSLIHLANIGFKGNLRDAIREKQASIESHENMDYFKSIGWDICIGEASFVGSNSLLVNDTIYHAKKIVVATGSRPRTIEIEGTQSFSIHTNETIFTLETPPSHFVVLGGGPIGVEIAEAYRNLGSTVSIITTDDRLLPRERKEVSVYLEDVFRTKGITIHKNTSIVRSEGNKLMLSNGAECLCDALLVAIGRVVDIRSLTPEKAGIGIDDQGRPKVDKYLRSTNQDIFFSGDVAGGYQFTHITERHASIILNNLFSPFKKPVSYEDLGWVTFTNPEIATCGISYDEVTRFPDIYKEYYLPCTDDDRAITDEYRECKMWLYTKGEYIAGATIIMPGAGEVMQPLLYAMRNKIKIASLFDTIHPYPIKSRVLKSLFALHQKEKFTSGVKRLLRASFSLFS